MALLSSFATLLLFQLAGELLRAVLHVPLPGPVLGMALLAVFLLTKGAVGPALAATADQLLSILGLLFVPAGVGIVADLSLLRSAWLPLAASLVISTILTLVVIAGLMHILLGRSRKAAA